MINLEEFKKDWDWQHAVSEAMNGNYSDSNADEDPNHPIHLITEVYACDDGANDGPNWIAVAKMVDGQYVYITAGCDYTGWDCIAGGFAEYYGSLESACSKMTLGDSERDRLGPQLRALEKEGKVKLDWD